MRRKLYNDRHQYEVYPEQVDVEHCDGQVRIFHLGELINTLPLPKELEGAFTRQDPNGPVIVNRKVRFSARFNRAIELGPPLIEVD